MPACRPGGNMADFRSKFGGLWIDDLDPAAVQAKLAAIADPVLRDQVASLIRDGYVVIPGGVDHAAIDQYLAEYEAAADTPDFFQIEVPMAGGRQTFARDKTLLPGTKVLDSGMLLPAGPRLSFAPPIRAFLNAVFEDDGLAFQTLHFEVGSTQAIHQDTAYVVVEDEPMRLLASWIALEDIQPGSGELIYLVGGHRMAEHVYADGHSKNWDPPRDGNPPHDAHLAYLRHEAARLGLKQGSFSAKKGDVLIWHADLPHGGGEITRPGTSRRSLVTHYCPKSNEPHYAGFIPPNWQTRSETRHGDAYMSLYYPPDRFRVSEA